MSQPIRVWDQLQMREGLLAPTEPGENFVMATTGPGGGIGIPVGSTGLMLPATLRQQPNQSWPAARPAYDGPITLIGWSDPPAWPGGEYDEYRHIPRIYAPALETFGASPLGEQPVGFERSWGNTLTVTAVEHPLAENGKALRVQQGAAANSAVFWMGASDSPEPTAEILARVIAPLANPNNANVFMLLARASGELSATTTSRNGYALALRATTPRAARIIKLVDGTTTTVGSDVILPAEFAAETAVVMMRFRASGATIEGRVWLDGSDESSAQTITVTDTSHETGYVGVGLNAASNIQHIDWLSASFDGAPAQRP